MTEDKRPTAVPSPAHEARLGDRGASSGRNIEQSRAIGQDPPEEGSRMGREASKKVGFPGTPDIGTDAAQAEEATGDDSARQ
ncbi:hypothetical protein [Variovorax sp. J22R115]|uniref:hypothetical protein n=1 Tax=Variovorax sp. J22R115 TaxID=3053509 RepID=UPI0025772B78|nr:hypothetical protein [Variovorax sp. J22R115]MDM0049940.1 hypothetical protein [Variovorax sp. J22R115]